MKVLFSLVIGSCLATYGHGESLNEQEKLLNLFKLHDQVRELAAVKLEDQHADAHVNGFTLKSMYHHGFNTETMKHELVRQPFLENLELRKRLLGGDELAWATKRDKVKTCAALNFIAYPSDDFYGSDTTDVIMQAGDGIFDSTNVTKEYEEIVAAHQHVETLANVTRHYRPEDPDIAIKYVGLVALEFYRPDVGTILTFRGSHSTHDYNNILIWLKDWFLEKMDDQMRRQWEFSGLEWTATMEERMTTNDFLYETALRAASFLFVDAELAPTESFGEAWSDNSHLNLQDAESYGYWPVTKLLVEFMLNEHPGAPDLSNFYLTGHSQGGGRANLASMWQKTKFNRNIETITFAAVGGACFARNLGYNFADYLADVNPYIAHPQISDYVDVLDIYGWFDYDPGYHCVYGLTNITESRKKKYCEKIWGYTGPTLMTAASAGNTEINNDFKRCRYFTHYMPAMYYELMFVQEMDANGVPDGGCTLREPITKEDPNKLCPTGEVPIEFWLTMGGIALIIILSLVGLCCACYFFYRCIFKKKKSNRVVHNSTDK